MENIYYDTYYSDSALSDYVYAFYDGYNMQDYEYSQECIDYSTELMDQMHEFHLNMTRRWDWVDPYFLVFDVFGNEMNDSWFNCYLFWTDIKAIYQAKAANFVDFGDVYLSFIFNLLANSLQIKKAAENMVAANDVHDTVMFVENIGKVVRIILDFNSYQNVGSALYSAAAPGEYKLQAEHR